MNKHHWEAWASAATMGMEVEWIQSKKSKFLETIIAVIITQWMITRRRIKASKIKRISKCKLIEIKYKSQIIILNITSIYNLFWVDYWFTLHI